MRFLRKFSLVAACISLTIATISIAYGSPFFSSTGAAGQWEDMINTMGEKLSTDRQKDKKIEFQPPSGYDASTSYSFEECCPNSTIQGFACANKGDFQTKSSCLYAPYVNYQKKVDTLCSDPVRVWQAIDEIDKKLAAMELAYYQATDPSAILNAVSRLPSTYDSDGGLLNQKSSLLGTIVFNRMLNDELAMQSLNEGEVGKLYPKNLECYLAVVEYRQSAAAFEKNFISKLSAIPASSVVVTPTAPASETNKSAVISKTNTPSQTAQTPIRPMPIAGMDISIDSKFTSDVNQSQFKNSILALKAKGIIGGYPDGTFKPFNTINRAEFLQLLLGAKYSQQEIAACTASYFIDVPADAWYAPYVCFAKEKGIIDGYADGTFRPEATVNVAEALKISLKGFGIDVRPTNKGEEWHAPYTELAKEKGWSPPTFSTPDKLLTREEMAELIHRMLSK